MDLTAEQKRALVARHMPILLVSADDVGPPIDPVKFIHACALWGGRRPALDDKAAWGRAAASGQRLPLIEKGDLHPGNLPLGAAGHIGHEVDELWLDCAGWRAGPDVDPAADNREPNLAELRSMFASGPAPVVRAEVCAGDSWEALAATASAGPSLGLDGAELADFLARTVLVNFHCLFAARWDDQREFLDDGTPYAAAGYEGDWACLSLLFSADDPRADPTVLQPRYALCERRFRNQSASFGESRMARGFDPVPWSAMPKLDDRPVVLVSTGTHNLYPADVATTPQGGVKAQSTDFNFAGNLTDDVNKWVKKTVTKNGHVSAAVLGVTLAKMAAGAAVAGPFGALAGLVAGITEAGPIGKALGKDPGPIEIDPTTTNPPDGKLKDPKDKFKDGSGLSQKYLVVSPEPVDPAQVTGFLTFGAAIDRSLQWAPDSFEPIDRAEEPFWPTHDGSRSMGYIGRWGVRCENDGGDRRPGDILPDYRVEVLRNSLALIA